MLADKLPFENFIDKVKVKNGCECVSATLGKIHFCKKKKRKKKNNLAALWSTDVVLLVTMADNLHFLTNSVSTVYLLSCRWDGWLFI